MGKKGLKSGEEELDLEAMLKRLDIPGALENTSDVLGEQARKGGERIADLLWGFPGYEKNKGKKNS